MSAPSLFVTVQLEPKTLPQKPYLVSTGERAFLALSEQAMLTGQSAIIQTRSQVFHLGTRLVHDPCTSSIQAVRAPKSQRETADSRCEFF